MKKGQRIIVIGAGISGLSTAYWLHKAGFEVTVLEQASRTGGSIVTEKAKGFLIDMGPNSTLETSKVLSDLIIDLDLESEKIYASESAANRYIVKNGNLLAVPTSLPGFFKTSLFSPFAKMGLIKEPFLKPKRVDDISIAAFVRYRLGQEFLDYAINPFVAGVYAGDPEQLSTPAAFPKLFALEQKYGSLIKGAILGARDRKKRGEVAKDRARLFSFKGGMQTLTDRLTDRITKQIKLDIEVNRIIKTVNGFEVVVTSGGNVEKLISDKLVLSVPAHPMARLIQRLSPAASILLEQINYPPVAVVYTGFKAQDIGRTLDGFGFLVPEVEKLDILGSIWSSTIFPGRAPSGHVAFTTFIGGTRQPELALSDEKHLIDMAVNNMKSLINVKGYPVFTRVKQWKKAIPQYKMGYQKIQELFKSLQSEFPGLYFAGNLQRGISVGDSVLSAEQTLQNIITS